MANAEYGFALAQLIQQGMGRAAEGQLALARMLEDQRRYDAEAPLREAQIANLKATREATVAGTEATRAGTDATRQDIAFKNEAKPFRLDEMRNQGKLLAANVIKAEQSNDPRLFKAELAKTEGESLLIAAQSRLMNAQADEATDPEMRASRRRGTLLDEQAKGVALQKDKATLDEFLSGADARARTQRAQAGIAERELANMASPEEAKVLRDLSVASAKTKGILESLAVEAQKGANLTAGFQNLKAALALKNDVPPYLEEAVKSFATMRSALIAKDAQLKDIEEFGKSVSQFVSTVAKVGDTNPQLAGAINASTNEALRQLAAMNAAAGNVDPSRNVAAVNAVLNEATDLMVGASLPDAATARPSGGLASYVSGEAAQKKRVADNKAEASKKTWERNGRQVFNAMSPQERDAAARYFNVGQTAPKTEMDLIRLIGQHPDVRDEQLLETAKNKFMRAVNAKKR